MSQHRTGSNHKKTFVGGSLMADLDFNIPGEIWKAIIDYPGYEVSNFGRVRSYWKLFAFGNGTGTITIIQDSPVRIMKQNHGNGRGKYLALPLWRNGKPKSMLVHTLVLGAFICPKPDGLQCCHADGDFTNNRLYNLRWGSQKGNEKDKINHGTHQYGERNKQAKLTRKDIIELLWLARLCFRPTDIAKYFGITCSTVNAIINRKNWNHNY
jgi:hypothetical protein